MDMFPDMDTGTCLPSIKNVRKRPETIGKEENEDSSKRRNCLDEFVGSSSSSSDMANSRQFFRKILEGNGDIIFCQAGMTMSLQFITPNAKMSCQQSVLSLVAPESRSALSRAIFQSAVEGVTRIRVRASDGRLADIVILCNDHTVTMALFYMRNKPITLERSAREEWNDDIEIKTAKIGLLLVFETSYCSAVEVNETGHVISSSGHSIPAKTNPINIIIDDDRQRIVQTLAKAKAAGHTVATAIHKLRNTSSPVHTSCSFNEYGGAFIFVYTISQDIHTLYTHSPLSPNTIIKKDQATSPTRGKGGGTSSSSAAAFRATNDTASGSGNSLALSLERHLSLLDAYRIDPTKAQQTQALALNQKRKRIPSKSCIKAPPPSPADFETLPERQIAQPGHMTKAGSSEETIDNDWGHFVFPDGDPTFNLPSVFGRRPLSTDTTAQPKIVHHREVKTKPAPPVVPAFSPTLAPRLPPTPKQHLQQMQQTLSTVVEQDQQPSIMLIDLESVLPRQQSIENYKKALEAHTHSSLASPSTTQSAQHTEADYAKLDDFLENILPRPESITAFQSTMKFQADVSKSTPDILYDKHTSVAVSSSSEIDAISSDDQPLLSTASSPQLSKSCKRPLSGTIMNTQPASRRQRHLTRSDTSENLTESAPALSSSSRPRVHIVG